MRVGTGEARLRLPAQLHGQGVTAIYILRDEYEPELRYLESLLSEGMVVIDGGASIGIYTILASSRVGESGKVLSFEPGELSFARLQANIALNNASNVRAFRAALADKPGTVRLYHSGRGPVAYALSPNRAESTVYEEVPATTIDETLAREGVERVDFVKLDIEGAEELALRGASSLFSGERPMPRVIFEVVDPKPHGGAWGLLRERGYRLYALAADGSLIPREIPQRGNNIGLPADSTGLTA